MNILLNALKDICMNYKFQNKTLLLNSFSDGYQLLESLASEGTPWFNFNVNTPYELAKELALWELEFRGYKILSEGQFLLLIAEVIDEMQSRGELKYFASLDREEGMAAIFSKSIRELRLAGLISSDLKFSHFVNKQKGVELISLLKGFESKLKEYKLADEAFVYRTALEIIQKTGTKSSSIYILPEGLELQFLPYYFLHKAVMGSSLILPEDKIINLSNTLKFTFPAGNSPQPCSQFSYLFAVSDNPFPDAGEIEIYRAYGNINEVSEVFRHIKKEKIPLDEVLVCYTHGSTYIPLIYSAAAVLNVPVTFAEGVPVFLTRPGKFINSLLSWLEDNCSVSWMTRLLNGGFMNISRGNILAQLLRESGVGWGSERYSKCLKSMMDQLEEKVDVAAKQGSERRKEYLMTRLEQVGYLNNVLQDFLLNTSEFSYEEKVNTAAFCEGLSSLIKKYAAVKSTEDAAALGSLLQELEDAAGFFPKPISGRAVLKTLKERIKSLMADSSGPEPGSLHVTPFTRREAVQRSNTFVIGLDSNSFPGKGLQDPILLDKERERISQNLFLRSAELERNVYNLASFLASRRGKIYLSFSCYDPVEGRPLNPTPLLLQVYRLKQRKPYADYSKFLCSLPSPSCYFSSEEKAVLGEDEAWLHLTLGKKNYAGSLSEVCSCYPGLDQGIRAEEARSSLELTEYDGKITIDPVKLDPRLNSKKSISVTGMEFLAKCPFAYFLNYILGVRPPRELVYEPSCWLDSLNRGILLHEIYSTYLREMAAQGIKITHQKKRLFEIAQDLIRKMLDEVPAPSPVIFEREREDIIRGLEIFLRLEEELCQEESFPAYLEVAFGLGLEEAKAAGLGMPGPVWIKLPSGRKVALKGRIDRIDQTLKKGVFRLWDFKTGSTYGFAERDYIKQGRRLQHALYSAAVESIFQDNGLEAKVTEAGYLFPTEKGEGKKYVLEQGQREKALQALDKILDILSRGSFFPTNDKERCRFCDYIDACRFPASVEKIQVKMDESKEEAVLAWKELQAYE